MTSEQQAQKLHTDDVHHPDPGSASDWLKFHNDDMHYPDFASASDWLKENSLAAQPIRSTTKIWPVHATSMEPLRPPLRCHFAVFSA